MSDITQEQMLDAIEENNILSRYVLWQNWYSTTDKKFRKQQRDIVEYHTFLAEAHREQAIEWHLL